jgi:hypothetical protein
MTSKTVHVKAHTRTIHTRVYKFVCVGCNKKVERETYATVCPAYGNECQGAKSKCNRVTKSYQNSSDLN